jgi:hypothetical protein
MPKFAKPFWGAPNGEIYPRLFVEGDDCPPELEAAARECGAIEPPKAKAKK